MTLERIVRDNVHGSKVRRMLEMAFEQTRMAMCFTDPNQDDNPIVAINSAFTRLTGYEEEEIVGRNCRFLQGPETDPAEVQRIRDFIARREIGYFEILNFRKDGTPFWNALHVGPVFDDDGELLYFFGSQWDVTEKVEALGALRGERRLEDVRLQGAIDEVRRLRGAIDQANDAILMTEFAPLEEPGPRITWVSAGFERMTGYSSDEVVGRTPRMFQGPETDQRELDRIRSALKEGRAVPDANTVNYRKDGTPFHLEWSIAPVRGGDGLPSFWLSVQRDVTERVQAQRKLQLLTSELNHRHKNVLALVSALQNLIPTEGLTAAEYQASLNARMGALRQAHDLVFSRDGRSVDVGDLAQGVLAPFPSGHVDMEGPSLTLDAKSALDLALALHELGTNAAKHGALSVEPGRVNLTWQVVGDELWFDWSESGGPAIGDTSDQGFGLRLLEAVTGGSERADAGFEFRPDGIVFRGALPFEPGEPR